MNRHARGVGVDHQVARRVDHQAHMARTRRRAVRSGEEHQVSPGRAADMPLGRPLLLRGPGEADPGRGVRLHDQPGAVERVRPGAAPLVGLADLGTCVGDRGGGRLPRRGHGCTAVVAEERQERPYGDRGRDETAGRAGAATADTVRNDGLLPGGLVGGPGLAVFLAVGRQAGELRVR